MDCLKSYFEITGHIVALDHTSLPSSYFGGIAAERPERGRNSAKAEEATTRVDRSGRASLFEHWVKTSFHGIREFGELIRREQIAFVKRPYLFGLYGIGKQIEVIEMHRDYVFG